MSAMTRGEEALARMRASMRPLHDRIEASLDLMTPELDSRRYQRFLERSYGFISACERRIDVNGAPPALRLADRLKSELLRSDLERFGHTTASLSALKSPSTLPPVESWPAALGYFYVVEGSTLGGQIIARHVRATIGSEQPVGFLSGGRSEVALRWKQMLAVMMGEMANDAAERDVTAAAAQTFELLRHWHAA